MVEMVVDAVMIHNNVEDNLELKQQVQIAGITVGAAPVPVLAWVY